MARVTVEDCVIKVPNRFELVLLSSQRARSISSGAQLTIDRDNDKNPVVALREIADEMVNLEELEDALVQGLQRFVEMDDPDVDELDTASFQAEISGEVGPANADEEIKEDVLTMEGDDVSDHGGDVLMEAAGDDDGEESLD